MTRIVDKPWAVLTKGVIVTVAHDSNWVPKGTICLSHGDKPVEVLGGILGAVAGDVLIWFNPEDYHIVRRYVDRVVKPAKSERDRYLEPPGHLHHLKFRP